MTVFREILVMKSNWGWILKVEVCLCAPPFPRGNDTLGWIYMWILYSYILVKIYIHPSYILCPKCVQPHFPLRTLYYSSLTIKQPFQCNTGKTEWVDLPWQSKPEKWWQLEVSPLGQPRPAQWLQWWKTWQNTECRPECTLSTKHDLQHMPHCMLRPNTHFSEWGILSRVVNI